MSPKARTSPRHRSQSPSLSSRRIPSPPLSPKKTAPRSCPLHSSSTSPPPRSTSSTGSSTTTSPRRTLALVAHHRRHRPSPPLMPSRHRSRPSLRHVPRRPRIPLPRYTPPSSFDLTRAPPFVTLIIIPVSRCLLSFRIQISSLVSHLSPRVIPSSSPVPQRLSSRPCHHRAASSSLSRALVFCTRLALAAHIAAASPSMPASATYHSRLVATHTSRPYPAAIPRLCPMPSTSPIAFAFITAAECELGTVHISVGGRMTRPCAPQPLFRLVLRPRRSLRSPAATSRAAQVRRRLVQRLSARPTRRRVCYLGNYVVCPLYLLMQYYSPYDSPCSRPMPRSRFLVICPSPYILVP